jgi:hypothetical protein
MEFVCESGRIVNKHLKSLHQNLLNGKLPHTFLARINLMEALGCL